MKTRNYFRLVLLYDYVFIEEIDMLSKIKSYLGIKNKKKIMVFDDEENIRDLIKEYMNEYTVICGESWKDLKKANDISIDLFIIDIILPGDFNGLDIAHKLRKNKNYQNTPIVFISAVYLQENMNTIKNKFKNCEVFQKPFKWKKFIDCCKLMIQRKSSLPRIK